MVILVGVGILHACAVYYLLGTGLLRDKSVGEMRLVLLLVQGSYFAIGGLILFVALLMLTHRFVGPACVLRVAVARLRRGDFGARLGTRRRDYLKELTEEVRLLRDEMAACDQRRGDALAQLEHCLEAGDAAEARVWLQALRSHADAPTPRSEVVV